MGYMDRVIQRPVLLDVSVDDNTSEAFDILGYEIVAICTSATLDGATNDISIQVDPGDGTFRTVEAADGTALSFANVGTSEYLQVPTTSRPIVGSRARLEFSETEAVDRTFVLLMVALPGCEH